MSKHINPNTSDLSAELAKKIGAVINEKGALYSAPENAAVVPEALIGVLAIAIATQYERRGHKELVKLSAERLATQVEEAFEAFDTLKKATRAIDDAVEAMGDRQLTDDDADELAEKIAAALGLDVGNVKAVRVGPEFHKEMAAVEKSDADVDAPEVAAEVARMLDGLRDGTRH